MKTYHVIVSVTNPAANCTPFVEIEESFYTLLEAEQYFAQKLEAFENSSDYSCKLNNDTLIVKSYISGLVYYYEIHTAVIAERR